MAQELCKYESCWLRAGLGLKQNQSGQAEVGQGRVSA